MWGKRMAAFLREKGQILWDVTVDTGYVQPMNLLTPKIGTGERLICGPSLVINSI
jgi:hypothetical protein